MEMQKSTQMPPGVVPASAAGEKGDYNGDIIIGGNAEVTASGGSASAGIGSGWDSTFSGGTITIKDNSKVTAIGSNGFSQNTSCSNPAIGASEKANPDYNPRQSPDERNHYHNR
ncbi:hypothetical protein [Gallintestinimicrobium sp.]|uniref:hypothetical protein n=1 Tax=Gallintestinimicrobium sp. TaxID=2981655 RepID=UPI003993B029